MADHYNISICAIITQANGRLHAAHVAREGVFESEGQAVLHGQMIAKKLYPVSSGYSQHSVITLKTSRDVLTSLVHSWQKDNDE